MSIKGSAGGADFAGPGAGRPRLIIRGGRDMRGERRRRPGLGWLGPLLAAALTGCHACHGGAGLAPVPEVPRELDKMSHPRYVIEPPDILLIDALRVFPKPPYRLNPYDALNIQASVSFPGEPVNADHPGTPHVTVHRG